MQNNNLIFHLKLKDFEGPIALLDAMIRERKMDVLTLDVAKIAEQYLAFIKSEIDTISIDDASEFLEMATYLVNLKSKKIIPIENVADKENNFEYERDKLIQRIIEYRKYKELVNTLIEKKQERSKMLSKVGNDIENYAPESLILEALPDKINPNKLLSAVMEAFEKYQMSLFVQKKILVQELSIADVEDALWNFLIKNDVKEISFSNYLERIDQMLLSQQYIVTTFLAMLDLTKYHKITLLQKENDPEIYITRVIEENITTAE